MRFFIVTIVYFSMSVVYAQYGQLDPFNPSGTANSGITEPTVPSADPTLFNNNSGTLFKTGTWVKYDGSGNITPCNSGEVLSPNSGGCSTYRNVFDQNSRNGGIDQDPFGNQKVTASVSCDEAKKSTEKMCKGAELAQYSSLATGIATTFAQMKSQGNIKGACEAAQKITSLGAIGNGAVAAMCKKAISSCKSACAEESSKPCEVYEPYAQAAAMQVAENATAYVGSTACANAVAGKCTGDEASNDEDCVQFCMKPGRQDHPKCKIALNSCGSPTFATANVQYCTCLSNPFAANCSTLTGTDPIPGTGAVPTSPDFSADGLANSDYDMDGNKLTPTQASVNGQSGGSGGFDGGGGGSSAFGANNGSGNGDDPLSKDILTGTGSGGAVGAAYGGGGYNENGSGGGNGKGSASTDPNGIDLRAFLPGGKKDPNRNPASAGYIDPTITKANGLTNFQKVTRKMNEKRPELMP